MAAYAVQQLTGGAAKAAPAPTNGVKVAPGTPPPASGGHGAPHTPAKPQGTAGHWIQQGGQWTLIHAVGPGQWAQGTKPGFKAPPKPTAAGAASAAATRAAGTGNPVQNTNPLVPLTNSQIQAQATKTVGAAYKPVYTELNMEGSQEQAIMDKQSSDNQAYQEWLNAKTTSVQTAQAQVDASTNALESQLLGAQTAEMGAQVPALTAAANAQPGNVTNNAPAFAPGSPLGNSLQANQFGMQETEAAGAQHAFGAEQLANANLGQGAENAANFLQAGQQKEDAAFTTAMQKIATTRAGDVAKEASDIEKEVARLQGVSISVAENNRNYQTAAEKLGISVANTNSEIASRQAATSLNAAKFGQTQQQDAFNNIIKQATLSLDEKKFAQQVIDDTAANALKAAQIYKDEHGGALTLSEQNTQFAIIDKATGEINNLITKYKLTPQEAYQAMLNGAFYGRGLNSKGQTVVKSITVPRLANQSMLNAAYNLRDGSAGLTQGDVNYLTQFGLTNLTSRWGSRATPMTAGQGANAGAGAVSNAASSAAKGLTGGF